MVAQAADGTLFGVPGLAVDVIDIDDPQDPRVEDFRDLNSVDRRPDLPVLPGGRPGRGLVIAEGVLVAQRMIASRFEPHAFLGVDKRLGELDDDLRDPSLAGVPFFRTSAEVMAEIVGFHLNRGVLAVARRPPLLSVEEVIADATTVAILEGVNDHENIGSIFRNAAGLGVDAVLFGQGCADPLYRRCVRVSMGHALLVPFAKFEQWPHGLDELRSRGFRLVSMTPDPSAVTLAEAVDAEKIGFLVGAEGPGLTRSAMAATDVRARIPMSRGTDSLNVATAAAVAFYERVRSGTMGE
ncbi:Putative TrmH family tRNA/rRNA methyltransferase [Gordonia paraffinivorans]|uniref:TrmH family tRNA/rRNA methyltransferase n=1 Tax=Gordonia paraffinivorans TaxID=175628 RepID=A0ABD7V6W5_9ACTN|nr:Putative TrmH family tRNA/rRNA methyltransferase [Gordonia paraffinivorans]